MSQLLPIIQQLETIVERCGMNSLSLLIRNFELDSKFQMCESDSHIRLKTSNIMEVFL